MWRGGAAADYEVFVGPAGSFNTRHIPTGKPIPQVVPPGVNVLGLATVGLGLLNLGVGTYAALKVRQVSEDQRAARAAIETHFGHVHRGLEFQSRALEVLAGGQGQLDSKLDQLRLEMRDGLATVVRKIEDEAARNRRPESAGG